MKQITTLIIAVGLMGCATMAPPVIPDSVAPDGRVYQYISWPAQGAFWPTSSPEQQLIASRQFACLATDRYWA